MYQNYVFDLYGTLVDILTDEYSDEFWKEVSQIFEKENANYSPTILKAKYFEYVELEKNIFLKNHPNETHIDIDLKKVFIRLLGDKISVFNINTINKIAIDFRKASTLHIRLYHSVLDLLGTLKSKNKKIYLLSNAQSCFTIPELKELQILNYFDGISISSDVGYCKPNTKFFEFLFNKYSLEKSESIMIGNDWKSDIEGANQFGIDSLYIHQSISSPIDNVTINSKYKILDGDVSKIKDHIIN